MNGCNVRWKTTETGDHMKCMLRVDVKGLITMIIGVREAIVKRNLL